MQQTVPLCRDIQRHYVENRGIITKTKQNKNINAIEEQTFHELKIFNTWLIISGFIAVFYGYRDTHDVRVIKSCNQNSFCATQSHLVVYFPSTGRLRRGFL